MCEEINKPWRKGAVRARKRLEITCTGGGGVGGLGNVQGGGWWGGGGVGGVVSV